MKDIWPEDEWRVIRRAWGWLTGGERTILILLWVLGYVVILLACDAGLSAVFSLVRQKWGMILLDLPMVDVSWMMPYCLPILFECEEYAARASDIWWRRFAQAVVLILLMVVLAGFASCETRSRAVELTMTVAMVLVFWPTIWIFWTQWYGRHTLGGK